MAARKMRQMEAVIYSRKVTVLYKKVSIIPTWSTLSKTLG